MGRSHFLKHEKSVMKKQSSFSYYRFYRYDQLQGFRKNEQLPDILDGLKKGGFYRIKAVAMYDKFDHEISLGSVAGIKAITDFREKTSGHIHGKNVWNYISIQ